MVYSGLFFDGRSATPHEVRVLFCPASLSISGADGTELANWRYGSLIRLQSGKDGGLRLGAHGAGDARLVLADKAAIKELRTRVPHLFARRGATTVLRRAAIFAIASVIIIGALYVGVPRFAERAVAFVPISFEKRVGEQIFRSVESSWNFCTDETDTAAATIVGGLVQRLLAGTKSPLPVSVHFTNLGIENAFALPGGAIVVTRQLVASMEGPDELAGVLAHELGHVVERHAMIGMIQSVGLSVAAGVFLGGGSGSGEWMVSAGSTLATLSYSRRLEERADTQAFVMLRTAGITPLGMAALFDRLEAKAHPPAKDKSQKESPTADKNARRESSIPLILSSHPLSADRANLARHQKWKLGAPSLTAKQWATVKGVCASEKTKPTQDKKTKTNGKG